MDTGEVWICRLQGNPIKRKPYHSEGGNRLFFMYEKFTLGSKAWENKMKEITSKLSDK